MKKLIIMLLAAIALNFSAFSEGEISDYTNQAVYDFITERVILKSWEHEEALKKIDEIRQEIFSKLKDVAVDYEQEACILDSLFITESYEHLIKTDNRGELRTEMKKLMQRNVNCLNSRSPEKVSKWMYLMTGDVTSYYMTRSVAATFYYGFKVKGWYEKASEKDGGVTGGNVSLGNWHFYAPIPFGSNKKAEKLYKNGIEVAKSDGELYQAYQFLSQLYFEQKKFGEAEKYLQMAYDLNLGCRELDKIRSCNKAGYSLFQYNRNRAGIDEKIPENERDEND